MSAWTDLQRLVRERAAKPKTTSPDYAGQLAQLERTVEVRFAATRRLLNGKAADDQLLWEHEMKEEEV